MNPSPVPEPGRADRSQPGRTPLYLSALALVTALIAALVSTVALARSGDVEAAPPAPASSTSQQMPEATLEPTVEPTDGPTAEPSVDPTDDPTDEPTGEPTGAPNPTGVFTVVYQQEKLRLQPSCSRYVDLDEPRAGALSDISEFRYCGSGVRSQVFFNSDLTVAEVKMSTASANDCAQELRRAPIDPVLTPTAKQNFCLVTSAADADAQGIRRKIVLLTVESIAQDDTMNVTVTAWNVPR